MMYALSDRGKEHGAVQILRRFGQPVLARLGS
jgi:hypothetical protein